MDSIIVKEWKNKEGLESILKMMQESDINEIVFHSAGDIIALGFDKSITKNISICFKENKLVLKKSK